MLTLSELELNCQRTESGRFIHPARGGVKKTQVREIR